MSALEPGGRKELQLLARPVDVSARTPAAKRSMSRRRVAVQLGRMPYSADAVDTARDWASLLSRLEYGVFHIDAGDRET